MDAKERICIIKIFVIFLHFPHQVLTISPASDKNAVRFSAGAMEKIIGSPRWLCRSVQEANLRNPHGYESVLR